MYWCQLNVKQHQMMPASVFCVNCCYNPCYQELQLVKSAISLPTKLSILCNVISYFLKMLSYWHNAFAWDSPMLAGNYFDWRIIFCYKIKDRLLCLCWHSSWLQQWIFVIVSIFVPSSGLLIFAITRLLIIVDSLPFLFAPNHNLQQPFNKRNW